MFKNIEVRIKPTPPSFSKTPAKIIEPKVGASTWAMGSHKCNPYIGSFTAKQRKINKLHRRQILPDLKVKTIELNMEVPMFKYSQSITIKTGTLNVNV